MRRRTFINACLGIAAVALGPVVAYAAGGVRLDVTVIHATKGKPSVDPALAKMKTNLTRAFGGYQSFRQLDEMSFDLVPKSSKSIALPDSRKAVFRYDGAKSGRHLLHLEIPETKVSVDLRAPTGKTFYQAGLNHKGGVLILAMVLHTGGG